MTDGRIAGQVREALTTQVAQVNIAGLVSETLLTTPTALLVAGVVREVLGQFNDAPPPPVNPNPPSIPALQRPISILNRLTGQAYGFDTVNDLLRGNSFFSFAESEYPPSSYEVRNFSLGSFLVYLGGNIYSVASGTIWIFNVGLELTTVRGTTNPRFPP
jgi:hypothetical protein